MIAQPPRIPMVLALLAAAGCVGLPAGRCPEPPVSRLAGPPRGVVLCVPGAGGFPSVCQTLKSAIDEERLPLVVEHFEWTHGYMRVLADHVDLEYAREQGRRLAERVCVFKREYPSLKVYILAHSAGCAVALAAAESLPPGGVDRLVLLAPDISAAYDLRPALASCAGGIDVFYSRRDWAALGIGTALFGTADRGGGPAAGRVGFSPILNTPADAELYAKLRQHAWDPCVVWAGNAGGHYGTYQTPFLHAYVLPLFADCR